MIRKRPGEYRGRGVHAEVVEWLGRRILAGAIPEGSTLDTAELERELEVSRTALREAIGVLKAKGLVDARQKRGTFVLPRTEWRLLDPDVVRWQFLAQDDDSFLDDLAEMRGIFEPACARLAAVRRTDADLTALDGALAAMSGGADVIEADLAFHSALLAATHNELLTRLEVLLSAGLTARGHLAHGVYDEDPAPPHAAILDAVRARDPEAAAAATEALLVKARLDTERSRRPS